MRVLVVSDIHANLTALEAVLVDAARTGYDVVWCLGDTVGYGPEPNECVATVRRLRALTVVGNHDWAAVGRMDIDDFNPEARRAVLWTREQLTLENLSWLSNLPDKPVTEGKFTLTHGSPRDPVWEYILFPSTAVANLEHFKTPFCLVGHTHVPALFLWREGDSSARALSPPPGQAIPLGGDARIILNPGSVGQPRDNDPRASYAILDTDKAIWQVRRVSYPFEITQAHMRAAGLPDRLINRLAFGW
jgi:predicted phosphodiesterase